eukprot:GGOE01007984.1.p1 GENE.GGOE01007984.1~~GGOE01007984.1.p1  ORF type:complete len:452 (+),score=95.39 GGOE01007984.1:106-1356(+)
MLAVPLLLLCLPLAVVLLFCFLPLVAITIVVAVPLLGVVALILLNLLRLRYEWQVEEAAVATAHYVLRFCIWMLTALYRTFTPNAAPSPEMRALETCVRAVRPKTYSLAAFRKAVESYRVLHYYPNTDPQELVLANRVPCMVLRTASAPNPGVLFYLHGGAFVAGSPEAYRGLVAPIGRRLNCDVYAPEYRLAPEYVLPAAVIDAVETYTWLICEQQVDPRTIVFMGDNAGGTLCLLTMLELAKQHLPLPATAVLFSPYMDLTTSTDSWRRNKGKDFILDTSVIESRLAPSVICQGRAEDYSPYFFKARRLQGLPPLYITCGSCEPLLDEITSFVTACKSVGVSTSLEVANLMPHGFTSLYNYCPEAAESLDNAVVFVMRQLPKRGAVLNGQLQIQNPVSSPTLPQGKPTGNGFAA